MKQTNFIKWVAMAGLLIAATILIAYFHGVLGTATVFTHLFYIPIILAALWWGLPGMGIAVILALLLTISHRVFQINVVGLDDSFRAAMFIVVSGIVVMLRTKIVSTETALQKQAYELETRIRELSCLYAINNLRENDRMPLDDLLRETAMLLAHALKNGTLVHVRICLQDRCFDSSAEIQGENRLTRAIVVNGHPEGEIQVLWPGDISFAGRAGQEEVGKFIDSVAKRLGKIIEHENTRQELNRYRVHLEDLVRERTVDLIDANSRLQLEALEREKTQVALSESEKRYRILFENADEGVFVAQDWMIRFPNPALSRLTGYSQEELSKMSFAQWIHDDDHDLVVARYEQRMAGDDVPNMYTFKIVRKDGTIRWVELSAVVLQWQERPATLNFLRDITARKKMEASIGHIQKMEAVGALAGGVAHQFNNALSVITGNVDLLKYTLPDHSGIDRYINVIHQSVRTMSGLTQQLLAYARGGKYKSQRYSLTVLVKDVLCQVTSAGDKDIAIRTSFSEDAPMVEADPVQMRMVMLAVINNAVEAIAGRGRIRIDTHRVIVDQTTAEAFDGLPTGEYAGLSIKDNGSGMADAVREKIFEPFFTTKFIGRGLGMASAYGIIKNHGGYIYVDSEPGRGTTVHILLPPYQQAREKEQDQPEPVHARALNM